MRSRKRPKLLATLAIVVMLAAPAASAAHTQRTVRDLEYVGSVQLTGQRGTGLEVAAYGDLAFLVGTSSASGAGVRIVDISNPAAPVHVATTNGYPATYPTAVEATEIGGRDVLVVGMLSSTAATTARRGFEIYDISNPSAPQLLAFKPAPAPTVPGTASSGVSGLEIISAPGGRTLALTTVEFLETLTFQPATGGQGDFVIWDITDLTQPVQLGEWGVRDEPAVGNITLGDFPFSTGVDVKASANGTRAYVSYFDAGTIILDISDPKAPRYIGRTRFASNEEGNAQAADEATGGTILVETQRDQLPFEAILRSPALPGPVKAVEAASGFTPRIGALPGRTLTGEMVYVGRGCPAGTVAPGAPADPYLADAHGKIALVERGGGGTCNNTAKIGRAIQEGAIGFIMFNFEAGGEGLTLMTGVSPAVLPDGSVVPITIPAVFIGRSAGLALRDAAPVAGSVEAVFNGWGGMRVLSLRDPSAPEVIGTYATESSLSADLALTGSYALGTGDVHGSRAYVAAGNAGVRIVDVSRPASPREVAFWDGAGAPSDAPRHDIWGVTRHNELVLVADANYGLYILQAP